MSLIMRPRLLAFSVSAACLLGGCAYSYVGQDGSRHLVGLVHVSLPDEGAQPPASSVEPLIGLRVPAVRCGSEVDELLAVEGRERTLLSARALREIVSQRHSHEPNLEIAKIEVRCGCSCHEPAKAGGQRDVAGCASHA